MIEGSLDRYLDGLPDGVELGIADGVILIILGVNDGNEVASDDDSILGIDDGVKDGLWLGIDDGSLDPTALGTELRKSEGAPVLTNDGSRDGIADGPTDGSIDGNLDGLLDGSTDGILDGSCDG